jgi:predicted transposase YdaD
MGKKDIISKSVLGHLAADIANLLLGLGVETDSVELLDTEQQRVEQRSADLVARMRRQADGQDFILHIEIQNQNDSTMPLRMLRYFTDIQLAYPQDAIHQHLIYIGKERLTMPDSFAAPAFTYRYALLDMHSVDCSIFLTQDTPDALVLAILCDFKGKPVQDMVNYIVLRLRELMGEDESGFRNYFEMLETLAENRDLQPNIKEAEQMLTQVDVTKFASYGWGMRDGLERGRQEGIERGIREGEFRKAQEVASGLLQLGVIPEVDIARIAGLPLEEVQKLRPQH